MPSRARTVARGHAQTEEDGTRTVDLLDDVAPRGHGDGAKGDVGAEDRRRLPIDRGVPARVVPVQQHDVAGRAQLGLQGHPVRRRCEHAARAHERRGRGHRVSAREDDLGARIEARGHHRGQGVGAIDPLGPAHRIGSGERVGNAEDEDRLPEEAGQLGHGLEAFEARPVE